jgi:hypothetical protein
MDAADLDVDVLRCFRMSAEVDDPDKRSRWLAGTAIAMLLSTFVGFLFLLSWVVDNKDDLSWRRVAPALKGGVTTVFVTFWTLFPILYFCFIRKSAATVEYQRLVRLGEQERARRKPRSPG